MFSINSKLHLKNGGVFLLFFSILMLSLFISSNTVLAQVNGTVTGNVLDDRTGEPLPGTNVFIKGTSLGSASGTDGSFKITNIPPGTYTVIASFIGYHTLESEVQVVANEMVNVNFSMAEDVFRGEEIVVTGIASRTSKAVAEVAVSRVSATNYTSINSYQNFNQLVNGKVAGVAIKHSSGNVGGGFRFLVRSGGGLNGNEQPIIYIDGVRVENSEFAGRGVGGQGISLLADLNPEEIENIEVLKGPAAAASYGTSGSNGVVLITTKRGKLVSGTTKGVSIDYKVVVGQNRQSHEFDKWDIKPFDIANSIYRDGNIVQNSLSAAGGTNLLRYFVSYDTRTEDGIVRQNSMDRRNIRANIDVVPNDKLTFRVTSSYTNNKLKRPQNDNNIFGFLGNTLLAPAPWNFTDSTAIFNAINQIESNRFIGSVQAEYTPFTNFNAKISVGIDEDDIRQDAHFPLEYDYSGVSQNDAGLRDVRNQRTSLYTYSFDARYQINPMENLSLSAIAGAQLFDRKFRTVRIAKFGFLTSLITDVGAGEELQSGDENFTHRREAGIFAETNLSYLDQYFLSLKIRRDYASAIGREAPSINYPGASLAVRMDKYDWFPSVFGLFKARAAYGETGVLPALLDGIPLLWDATQGGDGVGATLDQIGNAEIKPERVKELEIGFDAELFNNYSVEFTYYLQKSKDSIIEFDNAPSTGKTASALPFNIGESHGSGFETLFNASPIRTRNFGLDLTLINNWQKNEVDSLGGAQPIITTLNVIKEGFPKHEFWGKVVDGVEFNDDGTYSGPIISDEKQRIGNPVPSYTGSFSMNFRMFKNLNLFVLADWATGYKIFNFTRRFAVIFGGDLEQRILGTQLGVYDSESSRYEEDAEILTPGTPEYQEAAEKFARLSTSSSLYSNWVEDGDYIKLREVSLSYSFRDLLPKLGLSRYLSDFQIAVSGRNLWTATKYSGADVEVNWSGSRGTRRGSDFLTLQTPKVYNVAFRFSL